jgi:hypothetical protein
MDEAAFIRVARTFGIRGLDMSLTGPDKDRLVLASILPLLLLAANVAALLIEVAYGDRALVGSYSNEGTVWWARVLSVAAIVKSSTMLAVAGLFIAGIAPVSRGIGSWAALITFGSASLAAVLVVATCLAVGVFVLNGEDMQDFHVYDWPGWAYDASALALGYAFLAYRGLYINPYRPREIVRQRRTRQRRDESGAGSSESPNDAQD